MSQGNFLTQLFANQAATAHQRNVAERRRRGVSVDTTPSAGRFRSLSDALNNPVASTEERDRILASLGGGLPEGTAPSTPRGFANNLNFFNQSIGLPFGAGPFLPGAGPGGNPLVNFGNQQPSFGPPGPGPGPHGVQGAAQQSQGVPTVGGPATVASLARLGAPAQSPGPQVGFNRGP